MARRQLMPRIRALILRLALLGGLAGWAAAQSQPALHAVPFARLAEGESYTAGAAMLKRAGDAAQGAEIARLAGQPELAATLASVDFGRRQVIAVFAGPVGSGGHRLAVRSVQAGPDAVRITVDLTAPGPEQMANDVISYPFAVVSVPVASLPPGARWTVVDGAGKRLVGPRAR